MAAVISSAPVTDATDSMSVPARTEITPGKTRQGSKSCWDFWI